MTRIRELDAVRGLAALMVVLHHDLFQSGVLGTTLYGHIRSTPLQALLNGRPFVLMFFVLSGFVLSRSLGAQQMSARAYTIWMAQRSIRLMLPAFASVALSAALYLLFADMDWLGGITNDWLRKSWNIPPTSLDVIQQGFFISTASFNNVLWSLAVEWRLSFLIPFMIWVASPKVRQGGLLLLFSCVGLTGLCGGTWPWKIGADGDLFGFIQSVLYFMLPFALGVLLDTPFVRALKLNRLTALVGVLACIGLARVPEDFGSFLFAVAVIWAVQQPTFIRTAMRTAPMMWLGKVSFSLYLVHVPILIATFHALHGTLSDQQLAVFAIVASVPAAWLFYIVAERPAHLLARAIKPSVDRPFPSGTPIPV